MYPGRPGPETPNPIGIKIHRFPPPAAKQRSQGGQDDMTGDIGGIIRGGPHSGAKGRGKGGPGGKGGIGIDTTIGTKGGKGKGRNHEDTLGGGSPKASDHDGTAGAGDDGWQVVKPKQGNRDWGALRGGRQDDEEGKPLPPWRRNAAGQHHQGAGSGRRGEMSPPHHLHGDQQPQHQHYHREEDQDHSPVSHRPPASLASPTKKIISEKPESGATAGAVAEPGPSTPAAVDPFTMALLRGASPEPPRRESPPSPFDHKVEAGPAPAPAAPLVPPKPAAAPAAAQNSLFGDTMGSDSLFGPPLEHEGVAAFTEAASSSSGSRFAKLFETLHADEPRPSSSSSIPQPPSATQQPTFPGSNAFPSGPFGPTAAAAPSPFAPSASGPQPTTSSLFGGLSSASSSSLFGPSRPQQPPKVSPTASGGPTQAATATQAQLQQALLQQLRAAPPATTAKVQQILERASSNASTQGGGVPALLHQLQAQAQQKREQAEQQARAMAAATQQQQQQAAALARLKQMQAQQEQMKKIIQEQHHPRSGGYEGGSPPPSASTMAALNRLLSASSSNNHQASQGAAGGGPPGGSSSSTAPAAPVGIPSPGIDVNALFWTYLDPHGRKQGPFSNAQMKTWHSANYFAADLPLAFSTSSAPTPGSRFAPLNRIFPPGSKPFSDAPRPVGTAAAPPHPSSSSSSLGSTPSPTRSGLIAAALEKQASNASLSSNGHSRSPPPPPPVMPPTQPPNARRGNHEATGSAGRSRGGKANRQQQQQPPVLPPTAPPTNGRSTSPEGSNNRGRAKEQASESLRGLLGLNTSSRSPSNSSSPDRITSAGHTKPSGSDERSIEHEQQRKQGGRGGGGGGGGGGRRSNPDGGDRPRTVYPRRPGDEKDKPKTVVAGKDVADPSSLHKGWLWSPSDEAAMRRKELGGEVAAPAAAPAPKKMSLKEIMACENDANNIKALMTGHSTAQPHKMKIPAAKKKSQKQLKKEAAAQASKDSGSS